MFHTTCRSDTEHVGRLFFGFLSKYFGGNCMNDVGLGNVMLDKLGVFEITVTATNIYAPSTSYRSSAHLAALGTPQ